MQGGTVYTKLKQQMYDFKICRGHQQSWDFANNNNDPSNYNLNNHSSSNRLEGDLVAAGYSWPPRSYSCTFCKREFRSAQALGGHMNVHRRDRARLRQSSPPPPPPPAAGGCNSGCGSGQFSPLNLNLVRPNPNNFGHNRNSVIPPSNCNPTLSSLLTKIPQFTNTLLPPSGNNNGSARWPARKACPGQDGGANRLATKDFIRMKDSKEVEKFDLEKGCGVVRLELEIGLIGESREELDLELRLGQN